MGCRLATPIAEQQKTEPNQLTERVSIEKEDPITNLKEPRAEAKAAESGNNAEVYTNSTLSVAPRTVTSQLSDIIDLCEEMEDEEVQNKAEAVLEHILRAQYQLERLGDAASSEIAKDVDETDTRFQNFLTEYSNKKSDVNISTARDVLKTIEGELDAVTAQLYHCD